MRIGIIILLLLLVEVKIFGQTKCLYDSTILKDVNQMYAFLDTLESHLRPSMANFIKNVESMELIRRETTIMTRALKDHQKLIENWLPTAGSSFRCNTNKELSDYYVNSINLLLTQLDEIQDRKEISIFQYNWIISDYNNLVSSRSTLMAIMDAFGRHVENLSTQEKNKKELKSEIYKSGKKTRILTVACAVGPRDFDCRK